MVGLTYTRTPRQLNMVSIGEDQLAMALDLVFSLDNARACASSPEGFLYTNDPHVISDEAGPVWLSLEPARGRAIVGHAIIWLFEEEGRSKETPRLVGWRLELREPITSDTRYATVLITPA